MKKRKIFLWIGIFLIYIFLINVIANIQFQFSVSSQTQEGKQEDSVVNINLKDKVEILVTKKRFYGIIFEENINKDIFLFYFIPLPLNRAKFNYLYVHLFLCGLIFIKFSNSLYKKLKGGIKNNEKIYDSNNDFSDGSDSSNFN